MTHQLPPDAARELGGRAASPRRRTETDLRLLGPAVLAWVVVGWQGWLPFDWLYHHRWGSLAG